MASFIDVEYLGGNGLSDNLGFRRCNIGSRDFGVSRTEVRTTIRIATSGWENAMGNDRSTGDRQSSEKLRSFWNSGIRDSGRDSILFGPNCSTTLVL